MIDSGWNCTAATGSVRCSTAMITPSSLSAVTASSSGKARALGEQRVVAADREALAAGPSNSRPPQHARPRDGLPCIGYVEHAERAAEILDDALQAEAHAEHRHARAAAQRRASPHAKSSGRPGPGDSTTRSGRSPSSSRARAKSGAQRRHLGAGLAEVVGQRVHERVLVVDQQHPPAARRAWPRRWRPRRSPRRSPRIASRQRRRLQLASRASSASGSRVVEQRRADPDLGDAVLASGSCAASARCSCCRRRSCRPIAPPYQRARASARGPR